MNEKKRHWRRETFLKITRDKLMRRERGKRKKRNDGKTNEMNEKERKILNKVTIERKWKKKGKRQKHNKNINGRY